MSDFHDSILPNFISIHLQGGPIFDNNIIKSISGREVRIARRIYSYQKYKIVSARISIDQFETLNSFFRCRRGDRYSFLIKDFSDYQLKNQILDIYNEEKGGYEFYKIYKEGIFQYSRRIRNIRKGSVRVNITNNKVDYENGIILTEKYSKKLIVTCDFYIKVRFNSPDLKYRILKDNSIMLEELELIEVG